MNKNSCIEITFDYNNRPYVTNITNMAVAFWNVLF
jgi:hypothetical protein